MLREKFEEKGEDDAEDGGLRSAQSSNSSAQEYTTKVNHHTPIRNIITYLCSSGNATLTMQLNGVHRSEELGTQRHARVHKKSLTTSTISSNERQYYKHQDVLLRIQEVWAPRRRTRPRRQF